MREKSEILLVLFLVSMVIVVSVPVRAWEYYDTTIYSPKTDNLSEDFGPRADKILMTTYSLEWAAYAAMETDQIDMLTWPIDATHVGPWTSNPLQQKIAVVHTDIAFDMSILHFRLDNRSFLDDGTPNPAYNTKHGNPMADVWLRRAIACIADRKYAVETILSGNGAPLLGSALYTPLSCAYGEWMHPELNPIGVLAQWCYVRPDGSANVALGNAYLDNHGYVYDPSANARKKDGYKFTIEFYAQDDFSPRGRFAKEVIKSMMETPPPNGLGMKNNLVMKGLINPDPPSAVDPKPLVMYSKLGHMYVEDCDLTQDPDHLYRMFASPNYCHPGGCPNYMYYPGDGDKYTVTSDGWRYTGFPEKYGWASSGLDFSDPDKQYNVGDEVWMNPANYWSHEMTTATDFVRTRLAGYKTQEFLAFYACGVPLWATDRYTAFHRTYTGPEGPFGGRPWEGIVNQKGVGIWGARSLYNMHPDIAEWGDGNNMVIRQVLRQEVETFNPLYANWPCDWHVLGLAYDTMISIDPYTLGDVQNLAASWDVSTWDASSLGLGTCSKITFHMRHDLYWSDGSPITASDVKFTLGGPKVTGSISNLLQKEGYPPPYWASEVADVLSVATPDPWTVILNLGSYNYFGLHTVGLNIVLPEHVWKPIIKTGDPMQPFNLPNVCSGSYMIADTSNPWGRPIVLNKNPLHYTLQPTIPPKPWPITIWTSQTSTARQVSGNTHYIYPRQGETGVTQFTVSVNLLNSFAYKNSADIGHTYSQTNVTGQKVITLWRWKGTGLLTDEASFIQVGPSFMETFNAARANTETKSFTYDNLPADWYYVKIQITITGLYYKYGATWVDASAHNPFNGDTKIYKEYALITSRYDIGGSFWKTIASAYYQPISDLKCDVKDLYACGQAYGSLPGSSNWNPACDINNDYKIDVKDYYAIAQNYGWTASP